MVTGNFNKYQTRKYIPLSVFNHSPDLQDSDIFPISVILYSDERTEGMIMKKYQTIRRLKLTDFEIRVAIDALAAYRRKQIDENIEHDSTNELLLRLLDLLEE